MLQAAPDAIEQALAKLRHWHRNAQARSIEETDWAIGNIVERLQSEDCATFLKFSGCSSA